MTATRRLAAILAADVAGYSRLMGADEEGTLARFNAHRRALVDPKIAEHGGRIVKTTGDGLLAEFPSVVDAVRCAVEVQRGMAERNAAVPAAERIEFRIGINLGDIIVEAGDIFGDGVNIAARLESLAEPGGVLISNNVHDQVRDRLPFAFTDLGEQQVKNIARPLRRHPGDAQRAGGVLDLLPAEIGEGDGPAAAHLAVHLVGAPPAARLGQGFDPRGDGVPRAAEVTALACGRAKLGLWTS